MLKPIRILLVPCLLLAGALGFAHSEAKLKENARLQGPKHRIAPFLALLDRYDSPLTVEPDIELEPIESFDMVDSRPTLRDSLALLIVGSPFAARSFEPGAILLVPTEVRRARTFGRYSSYDPERTRKAVLDQRKRQRNRGQRSMLFDEGEGGYVQRIGSLPPARDIGSFLFDGEISPLMQNRINPDSSLDGRLLQVEALLDDYATELTRQGVQAVFGPPVDVPPAYEHNSTVFLNRRSYSSDHDEVLLLGRLYVRVMKRHGLRVVAKHYLNMGTATGGDLHHRYLVDSGTPEQRRASVELYRQLLPEVDGVMLSHLGNPDDGNLPYSISPGAISMLTDSLAFKGVVFTDAVSMDAVTDYVDEMDLTERQRLLTDSALSVDGRIAVLALEAGAHSIIAVTRPHTVLASIERAYLMDARFRVRVREALARMTTFMD